MIKITRGDLDKAAAAQVISPDQGERLWRFLGEQAALAGRPQFGTEHLLWYGGGLIVMGAMGLFTTVGFSSWGTGFLLATALVYAVVFFTVGGRLWHKPGTRIAGGVLIAVAVSMAPLATYAVQDLLGWWGTPAIIGAYKEFYVWVKSGWLPMEMVTIIVGSLAMRFFRFPFLLMPASVALWFLSMDLTPWLVGKPEFTWEQREVVSIWFGVVTMLVAWGVDTRIRDDSTFWLHLAGLLAFWGGLTSMHSDSELSKFLYCLINVGLVGLSLFLGRRAYAVFGAMGITAYLGHLANEVFKDSILFPFALSGVGIAVIAAGLSLLRRRAALDAWIARILSPRLAALRPVWLRERC
ncbi:MAG: hypothetical protein HQL34_14210 [Alphaproteobacteria bacterium]|nr:hypothetical protein [Alphaproteobacteria bacterium]